MSDLPLLSPTDAFGGYCLRTCMRIASQILLRGIDKTRSCSLTSNTIEATMRDHRGKAEPSPTGTAAQVPSGEAIRADLKSLLSSNIFSSATRSSRFLEYVVEETLAGKQESIKESVLGSEVFNRVRDFD